MRKKALVLFVLIVLATALWLLAVFLFGARWLGVGPMIGMGIVSWLFAVIACSLVALGLAWAVRRLSATAWIVAGLLLLAGLLWPTSTFVDGWRLPVRLPQPLETLVTATVLLMPSLALVVAALLLYPGLTLTRERKSGGVVEGEGAPPQHEHPGRVAAICLVLSALLIAKTLYNLYWLTVWDDTTDSLGYIWLAVPILAALSSGALLAFTLPGRTKGAGLYALLIPALMIAVSGRAQAVDYRRLTQERAGQVSHAVEAYYAREGGYPQNLRQLTPWYLLSLPGPVVISGQGWCYDSGDGYYRLGYLDREHWSSPILIPHTYRTGGEVPDLPGICDEQITALREAAPGYYRVQGQ
jgi:hypothetical protein